MNEPKIEYVYFCAICGCVISETDYYANGGVCYRCISAANDRIFGE